jgi:hypothetical protein
MATSSMQVMNLCETCDRSTVHLVQKTSCNHVLHLLLSIFTGGGWLIIWLLCAMSQGESRPVCTVCGTRVKEDLVALRALLILAAVAVMAMCFGRYSQPHSATAIQRKDDPGVEMIQPAPTPIPVGQPYAGAIPIATPASTAAPTPATDQQHNHNEPPTAQEMGRPLPETIGGPPTPQQMAQPLGWSDNHEG